MVTVLTGENDFTRRAALTELVVSFRQSYGDFGIEYIDASDIEYGRLLERTSALPFLADRRMIILTGVQANKTLGEAIEAFLDLVPESTDLIIDEPKFDKRLIVFKVLKKRSTMKIFEQLDEQSMAKWASEEAAQRGGELSLADARYLVVRAATTQMGLHHELNKLLAYNFHITKQTIDILIDNPPQGTVFDLLDAAFSHDHQHTLRLYKDQRQQQVEPQLIMGMIVWQVHILSVVAFNQTKSVEDIARLAKINPFVVRKTLALCRKRTIADVKALVHRTLLLDVEMKTKTLDLDDAIQHFLLTI